jgi:hypothetical protein
LRKRPDFETDRRERRVHHDRLLDRWGCSLFYLNAGVPAALGITMDANIVAV